MLQKPSENRPQRWDCNKEGPFFNTNAPLKQCLFRKALRDPELPPDFLALRTPSLP